MKAASRATNASASATRMRAGTVLSAAGLRDDFLLKVLISTLCVGD
jgi:hypothetical protein